MRKILLLFLFIAGTFKVHAQNADIDLLRSINLGRNHSLDPTARFFSSSVTPVSIALPVGMVGVGLLKKDSILINKGVVVAGGLVLAVGISTGLKYAVNRSRPFDAYTGLDPAVDVSTPSFPSGHTSDAFATATAFTLAFPKWYVAVPSYLYACGVGYSRLHLGVHYPSDVLAGALVGSACSFVVYKADKWLNKKRRK